jgi:hypothetical protein
VSQTQLSSERISNTFFDNLPRRRNAIHYRSGTADWMDDAASPYPACFDSVISDNEVSTSRWSRIHPMNREMHPCRVVWQMQIPMLASELSNGHRMPLCHMCRFIRRQQEGRESLWSVDRPSPRFGGANRDRPVQHEHQVTSRETVRRWMV